MNVAATRLLISALLGLTLASPLAAADTIVLRSGERISDRTVLKVDEDGLQLDRPLASGQKVVRLDEVESATLTAESQADFDKLYAELGDPLFRVRWRLSVGDVDGLREPAEQVYERYRGRRSVTALLVATAAMRGRIRAGKREAAVEPMLQIVEIIRSGAVKASDLPGEQPLEVDVERSISPSVQPIWFNADEAKRVLPETLATIRSMQQPRPDGVRIYYGTLAAAAGDEEQARQMLSGFEPGDRVVAQLRAATKVTSPVSPDEADAAVEPLAQLVADDKVSREAAPAALFALGARRTASADPKVVREGVLDLLSIAALYRTDDRELAAAALYRAAEALDGLKDERAAASVRRELKVRFGRTVHAAKLK